MAKLTLDPVANLIDTTTAKTTINNNSDAIETAVENTLSRDGTTPNQMEAILDMNSNRIVNLPAPITVDEPLRLQELIDFQGGSLTINSVPSGGTTGQILTKNSNTNYDISWQNDPVVHELPTGGTAGQYLNKIDGTNYNVQWSTLPTTHSVIAGGTINQVLAKNSGTDYDLKWATVSGGTSQTSYELDLRDLMDAYYGVGSWSYYTGVGTGSDITPALNAGFTTLRSNFGRGIIKIPPKTWKMGTAPNPTLMSGNYIIGAGAIASVIVVTFNGGAAFSWTGAGGYTGGGLKGVGILLENGLGNSNTYGIYLVGDATYQADQMNFEDIYMSSNGGSSYWYDNFHINGSARTSPKGCRIGMITNVQLFNARNVPLYLNTAEGWNLNNVGCFTGTGAYANTTVITNCDHIYGTGLNSLLNQTANTSDIWINGTRYVS